MQTEAATTTFMVTFKFEGEEPANVNVGSILVPLVSATHRFRYLELVTCITDIKMTPLGHDFLETNIKFYHLGPNYRLKHRIS